MAIDLITTWLRVHEWLRFTLFFIAGDAASPRVFPRSVHLVTLFYDDRVVKLISVKK